MARITVEDCLTKQTNRFALIHLASKRTKQLLQGATVVLGEECDNKAVVTSLREIAEGKVRFLSPEEAERLRALNLEERVPGLEPEAIERRAMLQKTFEEEVQDSHEKNGSETAPGKNGHSKPGVTLDNVFDKSAAEDLEVDDSADDESDDDADETDETEVAAASDEGGDVEDDSEADDAESEKVLGEEPAGESVIEDATSLGEEHSPDAPVISEDDKDKSPF